LGANVDVKIVNLGDFLFVLLVHQVDRFAADDAGYGTAPRHNRHTLRCRHDRIDAADRLEVQESFVCNVLHNKPDLIAVASQHDPRFAFGIANAKHVPHDIGPHAVAPWPNPLANELLHIVLVTGWARRLDESFEKVFAVSVHDLRSKPCPGVTHATSGE